MRGQSCFLTNGTLLLPWLLASESSLTGAQIADRHFG